MQEIYVSKFNTRKVPINKEKMLLKHSKTSYWLQEELQFLFKLSKKYPIPLPLYPHLHSHHSQSHSWTPNTIYGLTPSPPFDKWVWSCWSWWIGRFCQKVEAYTKGFAFKGGIPMMLIPLLDTPPLPTLPFSEQYIYFLNNLCF